MSMSMDMPFPFVELYGNNANSPKIVPGVPMSSWKLNSSVTRCGICIKKFSMLRRRHHCRACGDICCRRCLGFCLVNVPQHGVDLSYTCAKCIRRHTRATSLEQDFARLAQSFDSPRSERSTGRRKSATFAAKSTSEYGSPAASVVNSPCSLASVISPCNSPRPWEAEYKVIVSQYHNQKLHSVCALLGDYLECKGGAIVLADEEHVWVLGHKGVRTSVLHTDTFLSICHQAMKRTTSFSVSKRKRSAGRHGAETRDAFHFFAAAPILLHGQHPKPIGSIIALDTRAREDDAARKVQKTLENLAQLVMNLLVEEKTALRLYTSGDFRVFASNALDLAPASTTPFDRFGVTPSPKASMIDDQRSPSARMTRSRSLAHPDESSFFYRYAESFGRPSETPRAAKSTHDDTSGTHAASNPEETKSLTTSKSAPRLWKNDSTLRVA